ncbi:MAG: hypothetical protein JRN62_02350 [Nitrososphaerota archaeon]|jgi:hypothetical protein|nr:hypothetical protein [Nitrososphaerota archaeon]MDG6948853.1 hypothetical protein [Nitrososphaerota archaeon]
MPDKVEEAELARQWELYLKKYEEVKRHMRDLADGFRKIGDGLDQLVQETDENLSWPTSP